ncbi:sigma-70 family RNA polymerase sigma factor [Micromonospora sp. LOL_013]|uniref:sigma-70 family RNA polymerase sigma factor n=1 Tax=Micromonospora sp. LOL_013 TaxID=3345414 RepID=UPI003A8BC906
MGVMKKPPKPNRPATDTADGGDREPTSVEIESWERDTVFVSDDEATAEEFPRLWNMSAGFTKRAIVRPTVPQPPEYVTVALPRVQVRKDEQSLRRSLAVHEWNQLWEAAQFRRRFFDEETDLPPDLARIADRGDLNIIFVPRTPSRYYEYAPLYHLLDRRTCERFGLPLLSSGQWPFGIEIVDIGKYLPDDFERRLSQAWASTVWRHLDSGSGLSAFSRDEPIRLLAHNLDFWVPPVTTVIQDTLRDFPLVEGDGDLPAEIRLIDGSVLDGAVPGWPRMGGNLWRGQEEATEFVRLTVGQADSTGKLRAILDAVRANRVADDFSARWSYAREDFERKLYRKRNKISIKFVELTDTIPVQGPETEVEDRTVFSDFLALLDEKERQIVILLASGYTKLTDIADELGYANHSPISKRLTRIRRQAQAFFDQK